MTGASAVGLIYTLDGDVCPTELVIWEPDWPAAVGGPVDWGGGNVIRLILAGAAGYMLWTRPELRERLFGFTRDALERLSSPPPRR